MFVEREMRLLYTWLSSSVVASHHLGIVHIWAVVLQHKQ